MPSGAKKRKALKKKKQQEAIGTSTDNTKGFNGDSLHGIDEHGSQDERESDSTLSSPGSQGNEVFGTENPSAAVSSSAVKGSSKEISGDADVTQGLGPQSNNAIAVESGTDDTKNIVEKAPDSSNENGTHTSKNIAPALDSVKPVGSSKVVISKSSEQVEDPVIASTRSNLFKQKSDENEEVSSSILEKDSSKVVTLPCSAAETSKKVETVRESEASVSSDEKPLLLPGPPVVRRTSWLSCCGLFDAMTGSER